MLRRQTAQQIVALKNHPNAATQLLPLTATRPMQLLTEHAHVAMLHLSEGANQGQKSVVLPQPDGPVRSTTSPGAI